jgi:transcriptional regulator with XRE-family HTH domain
LRIGDVAKNAPTVRMRRLGAQLRRVREQRGLTLDAAATLLNLSKSALNRMENAQVIIRPHEVRYLTMMYEVSDEDLVTSLLGLAAAGRSRDWMKRHAALPPRPVTSDFFCLEQDSSRIRTCQPTRVPGLLQTPGYAHALLRSAGIHSSADVGRWVAFRMARKEVLTRRGPVRFQTVVSEAVLRQLLGGPEVMIEQLSHLVSESRKPHVEIRILPFAASAHPGIEGPFTMLDVETGDFTMVVVEALARSIFLEDDAEVALHAMMFEKHWRASLNESDSRELIEQALKDLK